MYELIYTTQFKKDVKLCKKRNLNLDLLIDAIEILRIEGKLPVQYKAHMLSGKYTGCWECHLKPDWLLVWKQDDSKLTLLLLNTGTHSDLF